MWICGTMVLGTFFKILSDTFLRIDLYEGKGERENNIFIGGL